MTTPSYVEETFGILTDDDLYLDCVLIKPADMRDADLRALRVWVPKHPLTKTSLITCARQEILPYGRSGSVAHLVFDLRGTGNSDAKDERYDLDLQAIRLWAEERFPNARARRRRLDIAFFGEPDCRGKRVSLLPLRPGVVMETYIYPAAGLPARRPCILYLSTYANFSQQDDALCVALAEAGYDVFGCDPLRYLLHASAEKRLTPDQLWHDLEVVRQMLPSAPIFVGQPIAAGLALLWASTELNNRGVIAIGQAQLGFRPRHIFDNDNPHTFLLSRYAGRISPRPVALLGLKGHPLGGDPDELGVLQQAAGQPRRLDYVSEITPALLLDRLGWLQRVSQ